MSSWSVSLTYPVAASQEEATGWEDALGEDASVSVVPGESTTVTLWIDADDAVAASAAAVASVSKVVPLPAVSVRAATEEVYVAEAEAPTVPELVSSVEAGEMLGVSRQRVNQLAKDHPRFPAPLYSLRTGPLWTRSAIEWFNESVDRRPGRPAQVKQSA